MKKITDNDHWYYDEETGELKRSRELLLGKQGNVFVKIANNLFKKGADPGMETDAPSPGGEDEIDMETDEVSGPKSVHEDKYHGDYDIDQRPTEEIVVESAYLVLFAEWGWDDARSNKGQEPMASNYKKLAVENNCVQHVTDEMANDLTDLLFVNELDAENFSGSLQEEWDVGGNLINVINVHLVPQDDPRIGNELETFGLGEFLGDAKLSSGDVYSVYRNPY